MTCLLSDAKEAFSRNGYFFRETEFVLGEQLKETEHYYQLLMELSKQPLAIAQLEKMTQIGRHPANRSRVQKTSGGHQNNGLEIFRPLNGRLQGQLFLQKRGCRQKYLRINPLPYAIAGRIFELPQT